jgi:hypothetical protein
MWRFLILAAVSILAGLVIGIPLGAILVLNTWTGWLVWVPVALVTVGTFGSGISLFPAPLNTASIEATLKECYKLREIHLTEGRPGRYEGTGTAIDGTTLKFLGVIQRAKKLLWVLEDPKGGRKEDWLDLTWLIRIGLDRPRQQRHRRTRST